MNDANGNILEARAVGRTAGPTGNWLIRDVSLAIALGDKVALVGPSGSGKTVLLRVLAMLDPVDRGELLWHGHEVAREAIPLFRSRVIYLHQQPALIEGTVEMNLRYPFALRAHRDRKFDAQLIRAWLTKLGRDESFLKKETRDLSGGERQLTALLRAMQLQPELLLLDEPTSALDQRATAAVEECLRQWQQEQVDKRSLVIVSHNLAQVERLVDRSLGVDEGRLEVASR